MTFAITMLCTWISRWPHNFLNYFAKDFKKINTKFDQQKKTLTENSIQDFSRVLKNLLFEEKMW